DHLAGVDLTKQASTPQVVDADGPVSVHADAGDLGQGVHGEVRSPTNRVQVGAGGGEPTAPGDVAVEGTEALLAVTVDVVGQRETRLLHRLEERAEQRTARRPPLEH